MNYVLEIFTNFYQIVNIDENLFSISGLHGSLVMSHRTKIINPMEYILRRISYGILIICALALALFVLLRIDVPPLEVGRI